MLHNALRCLITGTACLGLLMVSPCDVAAQVSLSIGDDSYADISYDGSGAYTEYASHVTSCENCVSAWEDFCPIPVTPLGWARGEYLMWWSTGNELPPLITTSPDGTSRLTAGVVGAAGTEVLFGDEPIDGGIRPGLRISAGRWLDECQDLGFEVVYFSAFDDNGSGDFFGQTGTIPGSPILARPFYDVDQMRENAQLVSFPDLVDGQISASSSSEMHSVSVLMRRHFHSGPRGRIDLIGGYRYFRYREGIEIQESLVSTDTGGILPVGTTFDIADRFKAENDFHGGDLGIVAEFYRDALTIELLAKVALGNLHRNVGINGSTRITTPPPAPTATSYNAGLMALSTNSGDRTDNDFAALPEFGVNLNYDATRCLSLNVGYTLVMLNDVARTGEQMDRLINPTYLPGQTPSGAPRPRSQFDNVADLWVHGVSVGLTFEH